MKLKWQQAPVKTQWGDDMVVASVAIDKDHTVCLYCEREQIAKVEVMFTSPAAQRTWVGLTDDDAQDVIKQVMQSLTKGSNTYTLSANMVWVAIVKEVEAKLKEKNT